MTVMMLTSENEADVIAANAQIMTDAGIPTEDGKTTNWSIPTKVYNQNLWFIKMPPPEGWNSISQEIMMIDVINVDQTPFDSSWYPPITPPELKSEDKPRMRIENV